MAPSPPPIFVAARTGNAEMVKLLLEFGADPNVKNSDGDTALMNAVTLEMFDVALILLEAGADPNSSNLNGITAVSIAARIGSGKISSLLFRHGAVPRNKDLLAADDEFKDAWQLWLTKIKLERRHESEQN